jgi:hypothetical protein
MRRYSLQREAAVLFVQADQNEIRNQPRSEHLNHVHANAGRIFALRSLGGGSCNLVRSNALPG